ncbi:MAG: GtrA family protein [Actinobacteria bacterium]|nr:GtrA family protein [Actinomycetota bacterium]
MISTSISQSALFVSYGLLALTGAVWCNVVANSLAAAPAYFLHRRWVWGKVGRHDLLREIVPFWVLAGAGMALSIVTVGMVSHLGRVHEWPHDLASVAVNGANLAAFAGVWVAKLLAYDRVLFGTRDSRISFRRMLSADPQGQRPGAVLADGERVVDGSLGA